MITLGMNVSLINEAISVLLPTPSTKCVLVSCICTRSVYYYHRQQEEYERLFSLYIKMYKFSK